MTNENMDKLPSEFLKIEIPDDAYRWLLRTRQEIGNGIMVSSLAIEDSTIYEYRVSATVIEKNIIKYELYNKYKHLSAEIQID